MVYYFKFKDSDGYTPMAMLPYKDGQTVFLIALATLKATRDAKKDFTYEYDYLTTLFTQVIEGSKLNEGYLSAPWELTEEFD